MVEVHPLSHLQSVVELADEDSRPPWMVSFEHVDGGSEAFCYRDLMCLLYNPRGIIEIRFATGTVAIHGRNLQPVWLALHSHRAVVVREGTNAEGFLRGDDEPHIEGITATPSPLED